MFIIKNRFLFMDARTGSIKSKCDTEKEAEEYITLLKINDVPLENLYIVDQNNIFKPLPVLIWNYNFEEEV